MRRDKVIITPGPCRACTGWIGVLIFGCLLSISRAQTGVTLTWNPDTAPGIVGYQVYSGTTSGVFTQVVDVGNVTTATLGNLTPGNMYFYAVAAYNSAGQQSPLSNQVYSVVNTTGSGTPVTATELPSFTVNTAVVGGTSVFVNASVNPNGCAGPPADPINVDVYWQYGLSAGNYTQTTPVQPIGSGTFPMTANYEIATSLMAPSVYHYQLVISSTYGVDYGPDQTFSLAIPTVTYTGASTSGTALSLAVDPNGVDTTVSIQYGLTQAYTGGSIALGDIGSGTVPVNVDPTIPGLAPNTEYHYRVVTTTALGTFYGSDETYFQEKFGTAAVLGVEEPAPGITGATFSRLGNPATNDQDHTAFQASVNGGKGSGVTGNNNSGIWADIGANGLTLIARTGSAAPDYTGLSTVGTFNNLADPVYANDDEVAFVGKLAASPTVNNSNNLGIWSTASGQLALVARIGDLAPDVNGAVAGGGPQFSTFAQYVLPDQGGVIILANLANNVGGVTSSNNQGIWAAGTDGVLRRIVCKGDTLTVNGTTKTIESLSIFNAPSQTAGQRRHFSSPGDLVYKVGFKDGSSSIVESVFP